MPLQDSAGFNKPARKALPSSSAAFVFFLGIFALGILAPSLSAQGAGENPALLIGNERYQHLKALDSTRPDLEKIAPALEGRGFAVKSSYNLEQREMRRTIQSLASSAKGKEFALLYFSGYGRRFTGFDYLLPTDVRDFRDWIMLENQAISLEWVMKTLSGSAKNVLIIMDSGRSFPEGARDSQLSLEAAEGVYVLYATLPGRYANAGRPGDEHSPFVQALLESLRWDPISMKSLTRLVREKLEALTKDESDGVQIPELFGRTENAGAVYLPPGRASNTLTELPEDRPKASVPKPLMVFVDGGEYMMGNALYDHDGMENAPPFPVRLSPFSISKHETTFEEYDAFCKATGRELPDDRGWGRGKRPVVSLDWYDAVEYCNWLSEASGLKPCYTLDKKKTDPGNANKFELDRRRWTVSCDWNANGYRLPTEAEWEYAARDRGREIRFGNNRDILEVSSANFNPAILISYSEPGSSRGRTLPVGSLVPNALGIHDMVGNAWEWCWDWYGDYPRSFETLKDPRGPASGALRVLRGGSWETDASVVRAAFRGDSIGFYLSASKGFRVLRSEKKN